MDVPPPLPPADQSDPAVCANCGNPQLSDRTRLPVCEPCRYAMVRFPFPAWVKVCATLVIALLAAALVQIPEKWQAAMRYAGADQFAETNDWDAAYASYKPFAINHRDDTDMQLRFAEICVKSHHLREAVETMNSLEGRKVSQNQLDKADRIGSDLEWAIKKEAKNAASRPQQN